MTKLLGNLRLTFAISSLTIGAIVFAIAAVLVSLFVSLSGSVERDATAALTNTTRIAAQIFQVNLPSLEVSVGEGGNVEALSARNMPRFRNHNVIDAVAGVSGAHTAVYVFDPEIGPDFLVGSTSLMDTAGERVMDMPIAAGTSLFETLSANQSVRTEMVVDGRDHLVRYEPIATSEGVVIGALMVLVDKAPFEALMSQTMLVLGGTSLLAVILVAIFALLAARLLIRPIPHLAEAMGSIAEGDLEAVVPYTDRRNEIGAMARAVEVFRSNGTEKAALDAQARQHMAEAADHTGQLQAISRSQMVVEFDLDGVVQAANANFLELLGYRLEDVVGRPNALFLFDADPASATYKNFWHDLASGDFKSGEYRRRNKNGGEVWIQSTFTPISGPDGVPYKIVQFATDVTARKQSVATIGAGLKSLAGGDLTHMIDTAFPPEFEDLRGRAQWHDQPLCRGGRAIADDDTLLAHGQRRIAERGQRPVRAHNASGRDH